MTDLSECDRLDQRRRAILASARALFVEQGYEKTTLGEIVERAGGSLATVYKLFGNKDGLLEADATALLMWDKFDDLQYFSVFETHFPDLKDQAFRDQSRTRIESILKIENTSQNTVDEVTRAGHIFKDHDVEQIILVSSPIHLPRCLRDACVAFDNDRELSHFRYWLSASPSITGYMGRSAADVAIFEPPHRPDRPPFNINDFLKRVTDIPGSARQDFLRRFDELLQDFDV